MTGQFASAPVPRMHRSAAPYLAPAERCAAAPWISCPFTSRPDFRESALYFTRTHRDVVSDARGRPGSPGRSLMAPPSSRASCVPAMSPYVTVDLFLFIFLGFFPAPFGRAGRRHLSRATRPWHILTSHELISGVKTGGCT